MCPRRGPKSFLGAAGFAAAAWAADPPSASDTCEAGLRCFAAIRDAAAERPYETYAPPDEWWEAVGRSIGTIFWQHFHEEQGEEAKLQSLLGEFGRHGAAADMRFLLLPGVFLPQEVSDPAGAINPEGISPGYRPAFERSTAKMRRLRLAAAKALVERFVKDRALLRRYHGAVIWSRRFLLDPAYHDLVARRKVAQLVAAFKPHPDELFWWHAREFMLLAHATGREDLLDVAEPRELHGRFSLWKEWLTTNRFLIGAHRTKPVWILSRDRSLEELDPGRAGRVPTFPPLTEPAAPFPDWTGPLPPRPSILTDVAWVQFEQLLERTKADLAPAPPAPPVRESGD
jgi:hypothetical protein